MCNVGRCHGEPCHFTPVAKSPSSRENASASAAKTNGCPVSSDSLRFLTSVQRRRSPPLSCLATTLPLPTMRSPDSSGPVSCLFPGRTGGRPGRVPRRDVSVGRRGRLRCLDPAAGTQRGDARDQPAHRHLAPPSRRVSAPAARRPGRVAATRANGAQAPRSSPPSVAAVSSSAPVNEPRPQDTNREGGRGRRRPGWRQTGLAGGSVQDLRRARAGSVRGTAGCAHRRRVTVRALARLSDAAAGGLARRGTSHALLQIQAGPTPENRVRVLSEPSSKVGP